MTVIASICYFRDKSKKKESVPPDNKILSNSFSIPGVWVGIILMQKWSLNTYFSSIMYFSIRIIILKSAFIVIFFRGLGFLIVCLHLIEDMLIRLSLLTARQERLELLAVFREVKMEHGRFSSDVNQLLCLKLNWTVSICIKGWGRNPARKHWRTPLLMIEAPQCSRSPGDFIRPQSSSCFQRKLWTTSKWNKWKIIYFISIGLWMASIFLKISATDFSFCS